MNIKFGKYRKKKAERKEPLIYDASCFQKLNLEILAYNLNSDIPLWRGHLNYMKINNHYGANIVIGIGFGKYSTDDVYVM